MPEYIINDCEVPDTINPTGVVPTVVDSISGTNLFNFIPYNDTTQITYITGSVIGNGQYLQMPSGAQIGDIAFFFDGIVSPNVSGRPSSGWTLFASESSAGVGLINGYFKVLQTAADLTENITGSQDGQFNYATTKTLGIFRPNVPICNVTINTNPTVIQPPTTLDKTLSLSSITGPTIAFIWYWDNESITIDNCYSSITMNTLPIADAVTRRQFVKYKTYNQDESRTDILCNLTSTNSFLTYFSVVFS